MGLFKRIKTWFKAEANSALDSMEDTSKMLDQSMRDVKEKVAESIKATAKALANQKSIERKVDLEKHTIKDLESKAKRAIEEGEDELAKSAIRKKLVHQNNLKMYEKMLTQATTASTKLKAQKERLESKYETMQIQVESLKARKSHATIQKELNEASLGIGDSGLADFKSLEEDINKEQDIADAYEEMIDDDTSFEKQFEELGSSEVDDEFERIKKSAKKKTGSAKK
jgi:phage shock protein A